MLDTRDLDDERSTLKQEVFDAYVEEFGEINGISDYDELMEHIDKLPPEEEPNDFLNRYEFEISTIWEIDQLENDISDWDYGVTLIEDDEFEDYVQEMLEDFGYISKNFPSWIVIDWNKTSNNVKDDYSCVEYKGITYYYR